MRIKMNFLYQVGCRRLLLAASLLSACSGKPGETAPASSIETRSSAPASAPLACRDQMPPGIRRNGNHYEIERTALDRLLGDSPALPATARLVPSLRESKPNGLKIYAPRSCSIMTWLGLQDGDLIESINGIDTSTPERAMDAYNRLRKADHFDLQLERRGVDMHLSYRIS